MIAISTGQKIIPYNKSASNGRNFFVQGAEMGDAALLRLLDIEQNGSLSLATRMMLPTAAIQVIVEPLAAPIPRDLPGLKLARHDAESRSEPAFDASELRFHPWAVAFSHERSAAPSMGIGLRAPGCCCDATWQPIAGCDFAQHASTNSCR
jgi:hypothetical protein